MAKLGIVTIHGIGETTTGYADAFKAEIKRRLGAKSSDVDFETIFYQDLLQNNQEDYYARTKDKLRYRTLRRFVLFAISDAASLEAQRGRGNDLYTRVQDTILTALKRIFASLEPNAPLIVIAQSFGGQVFSSFLWDAQQDDPAFGIWASPPDFSSQEEEDFCRGKSTRILFTTGCNIPVFVASLPSERIIPIAPPRPDFELSLIHI